jgi:hypothetical protein
MVQLVKLLKNPRTGEVWVCDNPGNKRVVDGVDFIEVHQPGSSRLLWIAESALVKVRTAEVSKK